MRAIFPLWRRRRAEHHQRSPPRRRTLALGSKDHAPSRHPTSRVPQGQLRASIDRIAGNGSEHPLDHLANVPSANTAIISIASSLRLLDHLLGFFALLG